jgi:polyhydroxyalkanoate synthesis regulator phasin
MGRDDLFRRSFEAGTAFLDMSRERAEALVKDLVKAGEVQKGKAQKAIDELLERSRKGGEELRQLIRREISDQIGALGLATRDDINRLEARLAEMAPPADAGPPPTDKPAKAAPVKRAGPRPTPATPATPAAPPKRAAAKKTASPRKKAAPPAPADKG